MSTEESCSHEGLECIHWVKVDGKWRLDAESEVVA